MIQDVFYFFEDIAFPIHIGIETSHYYKYIKNGLSVENKLNCRKHGVLWQRLPPCKNDIKLFEPNVTIWAYPSTDFKYIVAVYDGFNSQKFMAPTNLVVYNEDGSIHKIITTPLLKTPDVNGVYQKGYMFSGVGWAKNSNEELVMYVKVLETDNPYVSWEEERIFNPELGEFGDLLGRNRL